MCGGGSAFPGSVPELTESADGAAVGLVAQRVGAGVAEAQVSAGQDERVSHVGQTHHALRAVVADLVVGDLRGTRASPSARAGQRRDPSFKREADVYL